MKEILDEVERWREAGEKVVVATVVATKRSAPRPVGTSLAISESGKMCGSVSGGCVESDVYENAMEVLANRRAEAAPLRDHRRSRLVGRPAVRRRDRRLRGARGMKLVHRLHELREAGGRGVLFTVVEGDGVGAKALVVEDGETLGDGVPAEALAQFDELVRRGRNRLLELDDGTRVFAEWYGPPPRLLVYGAVDTAEALCRGAKLLGWTAIVADARGTFLTPERIPSADQLIPKWPQEAIAEVAPDHQTAIVVLTHDDKFDEPALIGALETEAFYIGALGSTAQPGAPPRAAAGGGRRRGGAGADPGPVRARHRRRHAGGDGALDPRRDPRRARRTLGRAAARGQAADPRRGRVADRAGLRPRPGTSTAR